MADRLLVDLGADGLVTVGTWPDGGLPCPRAVSSGLAVRT